MGLLVIGVEERPSAEEVPGDPWQLITVLRKSIRDLRQAEEAVLVCSLHFTANL